MRDIFERSYGHGWLRRLSEGLRSAASERVTGWRGTVDAVETLADPLAFRVLEALLGEPLPALLPLIHRFARYADARYRHPGETPDECFRDAEKRVGELLERIVADRTRAPRDDMPSRMLAENLGARDLLVGVGLSLGRFLGRVLLSFRDLLVGVGPRVGHIGLGIGGVLGLVAAGQRQKHGARGGRQRQSNVHHAISSYT